MTAQPSNDSSISPRNYEGLRGWLLLVAVYLVYSICELSLMIWALVGYHFDVNFQAKLRRLFQFPDFAAGAGLIFSVISLALATTSTHLFFKKSKSFPKILTTFSWFYLIYIGSMTLLIEGGGTPPKDSAPIANILRPLIIAIVVTTYLGSSRRVAATFVR